MKKYLLIALSLFIYTCSEDDPVSPAVCDGIVDCAGVCDGGSVLDCSDVCDGDSVLSGCDDVCNSTAVVGCDNICNSTLENDCAGVCGGDGVDADGDGECDAQACADLPTDQSTLYMNAAGEVYYNFTQNCSGFQCVIDGATASAAAGGAAADAGFTVSAGGSTILGFSFTGDTIAAGSGLLTTLTLTGTPTGLSVITLSDASAGNMHDIITTDLCE